VSGGRGGKQRKKKREEARARKGEGGRECALLEKNGESGYSRVGGRSSQRVCSDDD